jgi:TRAP-type C4-dicarboxylate transport system permease small subunit
MMIPRYTARLADGHDLLTKAGFAAATGLIGLIAIAYCYEVVARYFFFAPTDWSYALVSYAMCAAIFLAMPEQTRRRAQIAINFLVESASPRMARLMRRGVLLLAALACFAGGWLTADETWRQYVQGISTISAWPVPKWWVSIFIPYGMFSSAVYFTRQLATEATESVPMPGSPS